mgnify:CR=1 FL=1
MGQLLKKEDMKKTFRFFAAAIATVVAVSCAKEMAGVETQEENPAVGGNLKKVTLSVGQTPTKTFLDDKQVIWEDGDCIAVWDGVEKRTFTLTEKDGSNATFAGEVDEGATEFYIVSPESAFQSVSDGTVTFTIPETQVIVDNASAKDVLVSYAYTTDLNEGVQLSNLVSLVKFTLAKDGVKSIIFKGASNEKFVGTISINEGVINTDAGTSTLTITPEEEPLSAGTYYAAIAPCLFDKGLSVLYNAEGEKGMISTANSVEFVQNSGVNLKSIDDEDYTVKAPYELKTTEDLLAFGALMPYYTADETVKLANDISLEGQTWKADTFYGTLDGQGNAITHIQVLETGNASFINELYGTVKNIEFGAMGDGSYFKGNGTTDDKTSRIAPIATVQDGGQLTDIVNYAAVESQGVNGIYVAGICGVYNSTKSMTGCKNYGSISYSGSAKETPDLAGLIGSATAVATIENCENYGSVTYCGETTLKTANLGGVIAYTSKAITMKNCRNEAVISVTPDLTTAGGIFRLAGIAGLNQGDGITFEGCENTGSIECNAAGFSTKGLYAGGILGQFDAKSAKNGFSMTDCTNSGDITSSIADNAAGVAIGGMLGYCGFNNSDVTNSLSGCTNLGTLLDQAKKASSGSANSTYMGGMIGYNSMGATITDCANGMEGEDLGSITGSATGTASNYAAIGGIVGWQTNPTGLGPSSVSLTGCHNFATITSSNDATVTYFYMGSMIAAAEPYKNASGTEVYYPITIDDCINDGDIVSHAPAKSQSRCGGFIGDGANNFTIKNSTNNGNLSLDGTVTAANIQYRSGGFVGSISKGTSGSHVFTNLTNTGNITVATKGTITAITNLEIGGILGYASKKAAITECTAKGDISYSGLSVTTLLVKAIFARNDVKSSSIKNCKIAGNMNGTELTEDNFGDYIWGTSLATAPTIITDKNTFLTE